MDGTFLPNPEIDTHKLICYSLASLLSGRDTDTVEDVLSTCIESSNLALHSATHDGLISLSIFEIVAFTHCKSPATTAANRPKTSRLADTSSTTSAIHIQTSPVPDRAVAQYLLLSNLIDQPGLPPLCSHAADLMVLKSCSETSCLDMLCNPYAGCLWPCWLFMLTGTGAANLNRSFLKVVWIHGLAISAFVNSRKKSHNLEAVEI
ncbi:hypothetical protein EAF04_003285 [Stromatinia cepivora]|nr:hypothetical protein EAF04_003285 [Stromatinia cepivora]